MERGTFQLSGKALKRVDAIAAENGVSRAEVIRRALAVYNLLMKMRFVVDKED